MGAAMQVELTAEALANNATGAPTLAPYNEAIFALFEAAEAKFKTLDHKDITDKKRRELNALYMQSTKGDCYEDKPQGLFNGSARSEWAKWNALQGMPPEQAKCTFVEHLRKAGI